jgi:SAM-dependent methyltransferase
VRPHGRIVVETHRSATRNRAFVAQLVDDLGRTSGPFPWAEVGATALLQHARTAGLTASSQWTAADRTFVALELPDAHFDAVFSIFGVIMFPDWRKGLAEMRRVTRPGGHGVVATWQDRGAATFLLLGEVRQKLFPDRSGMAMPEAVQAMSDPEDFARALVTAGYRDPRIDVVTHDYLLDVAALDAPDTLFGMSPDWTSLNDIEKAAVIAEVRGRADGRPILPITSTALIGVAER